MFQSIFCTKLSEHFSYSTESKGLLVSLVGVSLQKGQVQVLLVSNQNWFRTSLVNHKC